MLNIIICDDDQAFSEKLKNDIYGILDGIPEADKLEYSCKILYPADTLMQYAETDHIDILFLDIEMPDINGMEVAQRFYEKYNDTKIIFISSFEEYVFYSIRFNPFRFIRKSNMDTELTEAVCSAVSDILLSDKYLVFDGRYEKFSIKISSIIYIVKEKHKNYMTVKCQNNEYRIRGTINSLAKQLEGMFFAKVNSGTLINMKYIFNISEDTATLSDQSKHNVSRDLRKSLVSAYFRYVRHING